MKQHSRVDLPLVDVVRRHLFTQKPTNMDTQNRDLPNEQQQKEQQGNSGSGTPEQIKHVGSESDANPHSGQTDMTTRPSEGVMGNTHSSGIGTKRSVTGSDFDGQVSPS